MLQRYNHMDANCSNERHATEVMIFNECCPTVARLLRGGNACIVAMDACMSFQAHEAQPLSGKDQPLPLLARTDVGPCLCWQRRRRRRRS